MDTKKAILCATAIILASTASARQISRNEAEAVASKYAILAKSESDPLKYAQPATSEYYVFNTENGGFVIVSGDSEMTELVAYSDESSFDSENESMMAWLGAYSEYVKKVHDGSAKPYKKALSERTAIIEPLVEAKWGQSEPFNNLCPFDKVAQQRVPAGCVAVSMAQIFHKWKWPASSVGTHTYVHDDYGELSFDGRTYFWPDMLNEYTSHYESDGSLVNDYSDEEANEVAKLIRDCGYAVNMTYGVDGSGAFDYDIPQAIAEHFRFNTALYYRDAMSDKDFREMLYSELSALRPVSFGGDSKDGGHQFVVDGYDSNNFVHINWGWNGMADGWYDINYMRPDVEGIGDFMNFCYHQSVVTIDHTYDTPSCLTQHYLWMLADELYTVDDSRVGYRTNVDEVALDGSFDVTCDGIYSFNSVEYNGEIALALFDKNDNIISVYEDDTYKIEGLAPYASEFINDPVPIFSINGMLSGLEDGTYSLRAVSKEEGRDDWQRLVSNEKISVQVVNGMAVFYTPTYAVSIDAITVDGTPDYDKQITLSASITNKSDNANAGTLDWEIVNPNGDVVRYGSEGVEFDENGKYVMTLTEYIDEFVYETEGIYTFRLAAFNGNDGRLFDIDGDTSATFTVEDTSGIKAVTGKGINITSNGHVVKIDGSDAMANVFDLCGRLVKQTSEREFSIEENGIYIVKVGGKIAKVTIR